MRYWVQTAARASSLVEPVVMADMLEAAVLAAQVHIRPHHFAPTTTPSISLLHRKPIFNRPTRTAETWKLSAAIAVSSYASHSCWTHNQTVGGLLIPHSGNSGKREEGDKTSKKRVFFLDVNPLCYKGSTPSLHSFAHWITLFFSQVSRTDPVIAVFDGERCNEYRRQLIPSYKAHRKKFSRYYSASQRISRGSFGRSHKVITDVLRKLNVPVVQIEGHEADDVVATLVDQVLLRGFRVVIASPDKDFKQLISEDVQIVMPMPDLDRWSFYTIKHYTTQYNCDPCSDLSLRCMMGDEVDGVPGIQHVVPSFGRKTALKLLKKHGTLGNLLNAAAVRTVGKQYAQDALTKYADYLRRNYEVLALRRDVDVHLQDEWLSGRDTHNDLVIFANCLKLFGETVKLNHQNKSHPLKG